METRDLASWAEFLDWLRETDLDHGQLASSGTGVSHRLFRGQSLNRMNINAYTLFGTEDALLESMAVREFDLRKPRI